MPINFYPSPLLLKINTNKFRVVVEIGTDKFRVVKIDADKFPSAFCGEGEGGIKLPLRVTFRVVITGSANKSGITRDPPVITIWWWISPCEMIDDDFRVAVISHDDKFRAVGEAKRGGPEINSRGRGARWYR